VAGWAGGTTIANSLLPFWLSASWPHDANFTGLAAVLAPACLPGPQKADVWSIGVILYIMLAGGFPWTPGDNDCLQNIIAANVSAYSRVH
jgi:serine/threonine protein kinase